MTNSAAPEQGQLVQVRSRPWVVNVVKPSSLPSPAMELPVVKQQNLLTLSSVEDDGLGEELQVVWEIEPGAKIIERVRSPNPPTSIRPISSMPSAGEPLPPPTTKTSSRRSAAASTSKITSLTRWFVRSRCRGSTC